MWGVNFVCTSLPCVLLIDLDFYALACQSSGAYSISLWLCAYVLMYVSLPTYVMFVINLQMFSLHSNLH